MKILLTHGYFIHEDPAESVIMKPYPPVGLLYLSAWLKKAGIDCEIYDSAFSELSKLKAYIKDGKFGMIGIYVTLMTRFNALKIMDIVRGNPGLHDVKIVIGGPDARWNAENYLLQGADFIVPGEGEMALEELISLLSTGSTGMINDVKGIFFRNADGNVIYTGERKPLDTREIPLPSYENIDIIKYLEAWKSRHGYSSMTINGMRGCPYSCNWCSKSVFGNSYRRRSPAAVVEEMIMIRDAFHPDQVWFTDDVFTISKTWLREFSDEVLRKKVDLPYECISRSDCLDEEIAALLKSSGCRKVWIGAESGSQKVIDLMNRKIDLDWTGRIMIRLKSLGISVGTFIMLGYQGEEKKDIFQTASFLKKTMPDDLTIGVAYPIKGTKYFELMEPFFDQPYDWKSGNERQIRYKKPYSDRFYRFAVRYLNNIVASRKAKPGLKKYIFWLKATVAKSYILLLN